MPPFLKCLRFSLFAFLGAFLLWAVVAWPLPMMMNDTISVSPKAPETSPIIRMYPGDHLQLLYQLWLGHDTFFGSTPWATNLYEFNIGNDADRAAYSTYYFPFNFFFSIGYILGGPAIGMNLVAILSLAISIGATFLWLRRWFPNSTILVACATLAGQLLPYRWHALLHGSPTGLAMMWVPVLLLGMDIWLRDGKTRGAALAGAAVFFSGWSDTHALFFTGILAPVWLIPNYLAAHRILLPSKEQILRVIKSSWPLFIWVVLTGWQAYAVQSLTKGTNNEKGRAPQEVMNFAREWHEVYSANGFGGLYEIYLGPVFVGLLVLATLLLLWKSFRSKTEAKTPALLLAGLTLALLVIALISVGPKTPFGAIWWDRLLRVLTPLSKLRQPSKIFLLLPPFISLMFGLSLQVLPKTWIKKAAPLCVLIIGFTFVSHITPHLCILDERDPAYAAVAEDAETARALVLPLWPGDSHLSSVYVYYAMQEHLRLVNGYKPSVNLEYLENIFEPYQTFNQGEIPNQKLDDLSERGITHLILHENMFPEKVSPFSVGNTLNILLTHPRLELLKQSGPIWAFRILKAPRSEAFPAPPWRYWATKKSVEAESSQMAVTTTSGDTPALETEFRSAEKIESGLYSGGAAAHLYPGSTPVHLTLSWLALPEARSIYFRAHGSATLQILTKWGDITTQSTIDVNTGEPRWFTLPVSPQAGTNILQFNAEVADSATSGDVYIDVALVGPAGWNPAPTETVDIYPTSFFHAGHTELATQTVHFIPDRDPAAAIFYGPSLPLEPGSYTLELDYSSDAPDGTRLGRFRLRHAGEQAPGVDVIAGEPAIFPFTTNGTRLLNMEFEYAGTHPVQLGKVLLTPLLKEE
jgi:hypothetical protein